MSDEGCWKCSDWQGHAFFCGCDCHAERNAAIARARETAWLMRRLLGTDEHGPFPWIHAMRAPDGRITGVERIQP